MWKYNSFLPQTIKQPPAAFFHIPPGRIEIVGVPRVGNIAGVVGILHQELHLALEVPAADAVHIAEVCLIHANQQIVFLVIVVLKLSCSFPGAIDPMLGQLAPRWRIDRVADLLGAGRSGLDQEVLFQARFPHQILHNKLGHGASANIAVAIK